MEMEETPAEKSKFNPFDEDEEEMKKRDFIGKLKKMSHYYYAFQDYNKFNPRNAIPDVTVLYAREFAYHKKMVPIKGGDLGLVKHCSYDTILEMTNNFSDDYFIQHSLFGRQFRGKLTDRDVVVKIWDFDLPLSYAYEEVPRSFSHQLELLLNPDVALHSKMANLIGFSCETKLALVWDLKLTKTLHRLIPEVCFNWEQRVKVARQVADALKLFHEKKIAICNFFSPCISVDEDFNIKLFEFDRSVNLAIEYPPMAKGSWGGYLRYYAPESVQTDRFETELFYASDVYHFGLLLLELTLSQCVAKQASVWIEQAIVAFEKENSTSPFQNQMKMIFELAMKCVQEELALRPAMAVVVEEFHSIVHYEFAMLT